MALRLLSLDFDPVYGESATRATFTGDVSVFDYDVVIWDPERTFSETTQYSDSYKGLPSLSETRSAELRSAVERRHSEFVGFLKAGRSLVVVLRPPQACYVATGQVEYSGTGRNARQTRIVTRLDLLDALPVDLGAISIGSGDRIEVLGDGPLPAFLRKYRADLTYAATVVAPTATALARVQGTDRAVSLHTTVDGGGLLFAIPDTVYDLEVNEDLEGDDEAELEWPERAAEFQTDLIASIEALTGQSEINRPAWADTYTTSAERAAREKVAKQQASVERARRALTKSQEELSRVEALNQLYLGTGRTLELQVRNVMAILGGTVREPEPGRADWHVDFGGTTAVLEVKGVTKSASEKNAAQLEKWVAGAFETSGVSPKGILVVNTWRDRPLAERIDVDFPAQMIPYSTARGHCLLTGLDLFVIASDIQRDSKQAERWRRKILTTAGRLDGVPDWRDFIREESTSEPGNGGKK